MAKVLVSIVSDQTIPNVLFIREMQVLYPKAHFKYVFITTKEMENRKKTEAIIDAAHIKDKKGVKAYKAHVEEDSIEKVAKALDTFVRKFASENDEFLVNLTGGTKLMSLAVFEFFKSKHAKIFYLTLGKNTYKQVFPLIRKSEFPLRFQIDIKDYFAAYGIKIDTEAPIIIPKDYTERFFHIKKDMVIINKLRGFYDANNLSRKGWDKKIPVTQLPKHKDIKEFFREIKFPLRTPGYINKYEFDYLLGKWFEEYVYHTIKELGNIGDDKIKTGVQISYNKVINEFDVVFIYENRPYLIECKTGLFAKGKGSILNDTLYKISALKAEFGLSVKPYLFALDESLNSNAALNRAKVFGITLINKEDLKDKDKLKITIFGRGL